MKMHLRKAEIDALALISDLARYYPAILPDNDEPLDCDDLAMELTSLLENSDAMLEYLDNILYGRHSEDARKD